MLGDLFGSKGGGGYNYTTDGLGGTLAEWTTDDPIPKRGPFDHILDRSSDRYSGGYSGGGSPFSGENALRGFKTLLDASNAMGDRRQGSYKQTGFSGLGGLFGNSRGGAGGMQLSSGPFGTTTYFPDNSYSGGGGYGGGGYKGPSRFAKVAGGAASGALAGAQIGAMGGPVTMAGGAILGGLSGLFS